MNCNSIILLAINVDQSTAQTVMLNHTDCIEIMMVRPVRIRYFDIMPEISLAKHMSYFDYICVGRA